MMREGMIGLLVAVLCGVLSMAVSAQTFPTAEPLPAPGSLPSSAAMPDPLVLMDGRPVQDREVWTRERRPELKRLFQHYMYGYMPSRPHTVHATMEREDRAYFNGKATKQEVLLQFGPASTSPVHLLLILPNARSRPAPVFVGIAFCGPFAAVNDPTIPVPSGWMYPGPGIVDHQATEAARGSAVNTWNIERSIDRGYAVALFYNGDVEPDDPGSRDGIRSKLLRPGRSDHDPLDWGAVAAWAWGAQRVVDFLVKNPDIEHKRIAVVGHSRNGKAALLAGAFDERISLVIPLQAGCGGTAPSRGAVGESVERINTAFPHWFNANFKQFNDQPDRLPFDQNALVALCAPRPVLFSNAEEDTWANPAGQFEVLQNASRVYEFLNVDGLKAATMPPLNRLVDSRLGYFIRPGKHSMTRVDWDAFLDFADKNWGKP
jgi:hypothetical protein